MNRQDTVQTEGLPCAKKSSFWRLRRIFCASGGRVCTAGIGFTHSAKTSLSFGVITDSEAGAHPVSRLCAIGVLCALTWVLRIVLACNPQVALRQCPL